MKREPEELNAWREHHYRLKLAALAFKLLAWEDTDRTKLGAGHVLVYGRDVDALRAELERQFPDGAAAVRELLSNEK